MMPIDDELDDIGAVCMTLATFCKSVVKFMPVDDEWVRVEISGSHAHGDPTGTRCHTTSHPGTRLLAYTMIQDSYAHRWDV